MEKLCVKMEKMWIRFNVDFVVFYLCNFGNKSYLIFYIFLDNVFKISILRSYIINFIVIMRR